MQKVKNLFIKAHEEGTDYQKALIIYRNTPLDDNLLSPMQLLQGKAARSDLPMSYAAKVKYGLASVHSLPPPVPAQDKNERALTHDYKLNQDVFGSYKQEVVSSYYSSFVGCKKKLSYQDT